MKRLIKPITKAVSVLLSMVIVCSLFTIVPFEASAAGAVEYIYRYWDEANQKVADETRTCASYTTITSQDVLTIGDGKWYVVNGDATIENRVTVSGTAHIILLSGTLRCMYGIRLSKGNSLFVYPGKNSEGKLNPRTPHDEEANLGGNEGEDCGEFVFYGGTLEAHNYDWCSGGAAIGGGGYGGNCGKLSFYGGTVDATNNGRAPAQKSYGAVIGDGSDAYSNDSDCYINIYGGNITADNHSYSNGSGIGGGEDSTGCPVNILGGKITAKAYNGAAIGSGQDGGSSTVTIKNAEIKAESNYGAGIGSGEDSDSDSIIIENSYVESASKTNSDSQVGAEGAGIGGGNCGKSKYIKIDKSVIIASSGRYGAGIGGGDESAGGTIEITDSCVFAHSAQGGAGIGGGDEKGCDSITLKDSFVVAVTDSDVNESGEKFLKDYGNYYNTIMYSISNPAVTEQAGFYAAGELTAMAIAYLIQGTHTGAGIGSGDSGKAEKILIDNCTVVTQAGECAAGIGGGDEGGFGTIGIKNSHIYSQGGKYGAGIGSGDEAEDCGTINITDSDITAYGGSEGAGIGTGNETDETAKIHISNSTVDAHGGDYAAGIGGGDDVNGGTIKISDSTVKAYGGKDAAGIGGGEDGDGGHIEITDGSNVYAEGKHYGAGIGGGEDSSGEYCEIDSDCTVEAVSGGEGNVQSIGHGDCGWYVSYTGGTLSLGRGTQVIAGSDSGSTMTYFGDSRFDAIRNNKYAKISPCEHKNTKWVPNTNEHPTMTHSQYCRNCGCRVDRTTENHIWNDSFVCTKCNVSAELSHLKFIERDNSGEHTTDFDTPVGTYYELPECKHIPDGYRFVCWKINDYGMMPGNIDLASGNYTVHALYLPVVQTTYIDEEGKEQTVQACRLNSNDVMLGDGFYVIDQNMESGNIMLVSGDAKLIIADGVTYTSAVGSYDPPVDCDPFNPSSLTIFGQREQTGTLDLSRTYYPAQIYHFTQYGAKVKGGHTDFITYESMTIFRGTFESNSAYAQGVSNLLGGKITIDCFAAAQNIYLGSFGNDISVTINSIGYGDEYFKFNISDGVVLTDEEHLYSGTLTREQVNLMEGKTLKPYTAEDYELVRWNWSDDYKNATAVLRSNVSGAEKEVRAKVTYEENGKYRTSTARCTFLGQEYTTTQTKQIIFDVTVANTAHGSVTADKTSAKAGNSVKLEVTPDDGYVSSALYYTDKNGSKTEIDDNSFKMPESDVTVTADFVPITPMVEPYIDANGEYHLGTVAYAEIDGEPYAVNEDGTIGELLDSVELCYFDFELLDDDTYRINRYTGPTDTLSELVIPKTFNGKQITVLGNSSSTPLIDYAGKAKTQFELTLTENIREIKGYTFYTMWVKQVKGDSSGLNKLGDYAFSWANSPDGYKLDIKLDHEGVISIGTGIFNNMNVTMRLKHATKFNTTSFSAQKVTYDFTDAHTYGDPTWQWADDHSSAKAKFTCTDLRCKHTETVNATVAKNDLLDKTVYSATVIFGGETYSDDKTVNKALSNVTVANTVHGEVTADKTEAYEGEKVTLTVSPEAGYNLLSLTVKDAAGNDIEVVENQFTMPKSDVTVTPSFGAKQYAISYSFDEYERGWISGPLYADAGEEVTVSCAANSGYEVTKLTYRNGTGEYIAIDGNTFIMPASQIKIYAAYKLAEYNISYETDGNGSVTGAQKAHFNDRVPLTVTPDEGWTLINLYAEEPEWNDPVGIIDNELVMIDSPVIVHAEFVPIIPRTEPYIDENGEYRLGNIEHIKLGDDYFAVEDGAVGRPLDSVELSYFDFTDNGSAYQINYYTGPTDDLTELVIPKTYKGKSITVLGTDNRSAFIANSDPKQQFTLTLNENIREIKGYAFYTMWVKQVKGDSSGLNRIGDYAFSWANSPNSYTLDIKLDHEGTVTVGKGIFNNMTVTARIRHATKLSSGSFMQKSISYIFTDAHIYGDPVWTWADDYSSATAKFTCTDPRCKHEETVDATVTSTTKDGIITYTATAESDEHTYTDTKTAIEDGVGAQLAGHSISLDGDIAVNFYMELSDSVIAHKDTAYMHFTIPVGGGTTMQDMLVKDALIKEWNSKEYYVFKCRVAAKEMTSEIKAQMIDGDLTGTEYTYSVKEYADYLIEHADEREDFAAAVPLVKKMLNYGAYAQIYFDKNPGTLANAELDDADKILGDVTFTAPETAFDLPDGVTFGGATLSLKSETTLSLYFTSSTALEFSCDGYTVEKATTGGYQIARIRGIKAKHIGDVLTLKINGNEAISYSPLNYCKNALDDDSTNEKLQNVVKALYFYWQAANAYFPE